MTPGAQVLLSGDKKILVFSYKSYAGHPRFYSFRSKYSCFSLLLAGRDVLPGGTSVTQ